MRAQPLIVCRDVEASSRFYQHVLGFKSAHGGTHYERLEGTHGLAMQLHTWKDDHHHGNLGDPTQPVGNGVLLWFEVDDFDAAVARLRSLKPTILLDVHKNPPEGDGGPDHREIWFKDPDGYTVVLSSPDGEASRST